MKKIVIKLEKTSKINFWIMFISFQVLPAVMIVDMRTVNDLTSFGLTTFLVLWDILFFFEGFCYLYEDFYFYARRLPGFHMWIYENVCIERIKYKTYCNV